MKIAWLPALIFCVTLALVAADLDLGPIIRTAQCRSMCLRYHMIDGICKKINNTDTQRNDCDECWDICKILGVLEKEKRHDSCEQSNYQDCQGCKTACTFFQVHGLEEEKYDPTKLPAPEEDETIHMNDYDIAVLLKKNIKKIWKEKDYYYAKQQPTLIPRSWVIVVTNDGVVKHYSWEKWRPKLQSLKPGPLYQAYITWQDWQTQLEKQHDTISLIKIFEFLSDIHERQVMKKKQYKPSFVVTWQQETGDGIMGNQVTDCESAQISLPCGKYLVRIATDDGPGSYPIIIDTGICKIPETSTWNLNRYFVNLNDQQRILIMCSIMAFCALCLWMFLDNYNICSLIILVLGKKYDTLLNEAKSKTKKRHLTEAEEGRSTEAGKMKEGNLTKNLQKKLMNQSVPRLDSNFNHSTTNRSLVQTKTNISTIVET